MDYLSIRGEEIQNHAKKVTWNLFHAYIDAHSQRLIGKYLEDGVQEISRLKSQCENITFSYQIRYNRLFCQVINKLGESAINYIRIFHNAKASVTLVVKS